MTFVKNKYYNQLRPITSFLEDAIYSILCSKFQEYFNSYLMLDAFAGTGRFGIFFFHKCNIKNIIFVEKKVNNCRTLLKKFNLRKDVKIICTNFFSFIYKEIFDIIIIDPPFQYNLGNKIFQHINKQKYINKNTLIIFRKHSSDLINYYNYPNIQILYEYKHGYNHCLFLRVN